MSDFTDCIADGNAEAEFDLDSPVFMWNGEEYGCAPSTTRRGNTLVIGGSEVDIKLTLDVRLKTDDWTISTLPKSGERVKFSGVEYRILDVVSKHGATMELVLGDVNR